MLSSKERLVVQRIDEMTDELVGFLQQLVRIPTTNPPGENYRECASLIGDRLWRFGYDVEYVESEGLPECTVGHPRVNVIGRLPGDRPHPTLHFNGHLDVVPPGKGWSVEPFGGIVKEGRIFGRGVTDQKAGIAASLFAIEAIRRCGFKTVGSIEQSATVDEESGGLAGVAYLARSGYFNRDSIDYVVITEPLDYDRICLGHRGVYWFEVIMKGRIAHGSLPFLGASAIDRMARLITAVEYKLKPSLAARKTSMPVVPEGARSATINVNAIAGGQPIENPQTPCVADTCRAIFDRRLIIEEDLAEVRREFMALIEDLRIDDPGIDYELNDLMVVDPTMTDRHSPLVTTMAEAVQSIIGRAAPLIASPGTYDQKHFTRIAGIDQSIAYGPGILNIAHQPDEYCRIDHLVYACKVMAIGAMRLLRLR
jgi:succinyl-diaminopimelate desuccinylase